jgi:hypothetical protein
LQEQLNGDTGPEADFEDLVVRTNVEQLDDLRRSSGSRAP